MLDKFKVQQKPECKSEMVKLCQEKIGNTLVNIGIGNNFTVRTPILRN
jgi:hypothetical protein